MDCIDGHDGFFCVCEKLQFLFQECEESKKKNQVSLKDGQYGILNPFLGCLLSEKAEKSYQYVLRYRTALVFLTEICFLYSLYYTLKKKITLVTWPPAQYTFSQLCVYLTVI